MVGKEPGIKSKEIMGTCTPVGGQAKLIPKAKKRGKQPVD